MQSSMCVTEERDTGINRVLLTARGESKKQSTKPPPPQILSEEDIKEHIFGIILASHYSLKKATNLFGEKSNKATAKKLNQIRDMETYEAQDASKLTKQEKKKHSNPSYLLLRRRMGLSRAENSL